MLDIQNLSLTCIAFHEEITIFPESLLPPARTLPISLLLIRGVGEHRTSIRNDKICISEKTADLFIRFPLLHSQRQKTLTFERTSMVVDQRMCWMKALMEGERHTLIMKGFTPRMALTFLAYLTSDGQTASRIRSLTLHLKTCQQISWDSRENMSAMPDLCTFITAHCHNLDTLTIIKTGNREWGPGTKYLGTILDEAKHKPPMGNYDEPIFDKLRHLHLEFQEANTHPFLSCFLKFKRLCTLRLIRLSPICARRQQLYRHLLWTNRNTLSSVYIDLFLNPSTSLPSSITTGQHTFRLMNSVIDSGLTIRSYPQTKLRNIIVQSVNVRGVVTATIPVVSGTPFLLV